MYVNLIDGWKFWTKWMQPSRTDSVCAGTVINVPLVQLLYKVAHGQTSVAGPHLGVHGYPTDLVEDLSINIEHVSMDLCKTSE